MIEMMYDVEEASDNVYYIMIKQDLTQEAHNFTDAIFLLVAVHYVFNMEYKAEVHDMLLFIQECAKLRISK